MRAAHAFMCSLIMLVLPPALRPQSDPDTASASGEALEQVSVDNGEGEIEPPRDQIGIRSRISTRLRPARGFEDGTYAGSPLKSYQRAELAPAPFLRFGILATKDPGEPRIDDFLSANIVLSSGAAALLVGDYRLELGQGLLFWRGYDYTKGSEVVGPAYRSPRVLLATLSSDETHILRGAAARFRRPHIDAAVFVSSRSLAASADSGEAVLASTALFRTESERGRRNQVAERLIGAAAQVAVSGSRLGILAARVRLDRDVRGFGSEQKMAALNLDIGIWRMRLFGELARAGASTAAATGVLVAPAGKTRIVVSARVIPHDFSVLHGLGFGERLGGSNESGLYVGFDHAPAALWHLSAYIDRFWFPHPTAADPFGASGYDGMVELRYQSVLVRVQGKSGSGSSGSVGLPGAPAGVSEQEMLWRVRLQAEYRFAGHVLMRSRFEKLFLRLEPSGGREQGLLFYQDVQASPVARLSINVRLTFFATGSFASRLYALERDLDGVLSLPALYGTGSRWYILVRCRAAGRFAVSVKYSEAIRDDVRYLGAGADRIPSNRDAQLGVQADWSL